MGSANQAESARLCFEGHDDALDYARELVQDSNRWLSVYNLNLAHRYKHLGLEVILDVRSMVDTSQYHLVFRAVPNGRKPEADAVLEPCAIDHAVADIQGNRSDDFMFLGITQLVQSPQEIIPSLVWLNSPW